METVVSCMWVTVYTAKSDKINYYLFRKTRARITETLFFNPVFLQVFYALIEIQMSHIYR